MQAIDQLTQRLSQLEEAVAQQRFSGQQGNTRRRLNQPPSRDQTPAVFATAVRRRGIMPGVVHCATHQDRETRNLPYH